MSEHQERLTTEDLASSSQRRDPDPETTAEREGRDTGHGTADPTVTRDVEPVRERPAGDGGRTADRATERDEPLLPPSDLEELRRRWDSVQTEFVDEPRRAVEDADALVAEVMRNLADTFASERSSLEEQWERAGEADTETLRVTLQRYRSFFNRLLST